MDAVKFVEERKRLCGTYEICKDCPANRNPGCLFNLNYGDDADEQVSFLEEWSAAHPRKTRQSVFLGNYPCARIDSQSVLYACPADVYGDNVCPKKKDAAPITCYECRREFWPQEVE